MAATSPQAVCLSCGQHYSGWGLAYKKTCDECGGELMVDFPYAVIIGFIRLKSKKPVTPEQYARVLDKHKREEYHLVLKGWQVPILYGLIALAADHPGIKVMHWPTQQTIAQVREWCGDKFSQWGFTPEEIEYLDKMREDAQGNITEQ